MDLTEMIEHITLGDIAQALVFIIGLLGSIAYLKAHIHEWVLGDIDNKLEEIHSDSSKNYIVLFLEDLERGEEVSSTAIQRFYELYDDYIAKGKNGYIKSKVKELQDKGVLKTISD